MLPRLSRGAACIARSYALADSLDRAHHGWSEFGNSRHFERTWVATSAHLHGIDADLGRAAPRVWRAVHLSAVIHRIFALVFALPVLSVTWALGVWVSWWSALGALLAAVLSRACALPYFRLDRPSTPIAEVFNRPLVRLAVTRTAPLMRASALSSRHLRPALKDPLADLEPSVLHTALALAPGFAGSIGELKKVAALVTIPPSGS